MHLQIVTQDGRFVDHVKESSARRAFPIAANTTDLRRDLLIEVRWYRQPFARLYRVS